MNYYNLKLLKKILPLNIVRKIIPNIIKNIKQTITMWKIFGIVNIKEFIVNLKPKKKNPLLLIFWK